MHTAYLTAQRREIRRIQQSGMVEHRMYYSSEISVRNTQNSAPLITYLWPNAISFPFLELVCNFLLIYLWLEDFR